jgi:2-(1,2-epoxy-1,2-dihydrophenyl)acetyl-CoA isomerase
MTTPTDSAGVAIENRDGVLRITLDRPSRKNSLDLPSLRRILAALETAATDDTLRVVVLASNGPDFCSGADWVASNAAGTRPRRTSSSNSLRL